MSGLVSKSRLVFARPGFELPTTSSFASTDFGQIYCDLECHCSIFCKKISAVFKRSFEKKKNGKSLCIACHLYARTMLIFSVLLKLTNVLPRTIVRQK